MIRVLFVCLGNICRSPMAEAIFRQMVKKNKLQDKIFVDSAGTGHWHIGEKPHKGTREILDAYHIDYHGIYARQIDKKDLFQFDYIIGMDTNNVEDLRRMAGAAQTGYIARLLDFVPETDQSDVPDPYFTGNFTEVYELVSEGCERLLQFIRQREGI
ncbi:low molecular weight phosphotyrosine protein phosphatase [Microaerobacter geothermalis]|uniref:low molecular weight protein-tyrosine-phosphatase n=1 Tax=Microaerobacter geothermalis TaxID=674972 RepID=UPI001F16B2E8|nr:low molecular weight protein-tyrosine-phosphatase [Microaerobacter geothermalis]MCF6094295.1 low molecular weight phosphotyrosine protein phosphatase [Microaerobacter geothermalis]